MAAKLRKPDITNIEGRMIYIASALKGDIEGNLLKAVKYCRAVAQTGAVPTQAPDIGPVQMPLWCTCG